MKNIFTRALALTMIVMLFAVTAFAAPTYTDVTYDKTAGTLDVATDGYIATKDATLLVVKAGANLANLAADDIVYIDQVETTATTQTYTDIPIKDRADAIGATAINVYIGGEEVSAAVPYVAAGAEAGTTVSSIALADEEPTPTPVTYTYSATLPATEYATVDAAIAALVVTKTGSDGTTATLTSNDYTVTANPTAPEANATVTLTVAITADTAAVVAPVTFTYKPATVEPDPEPPVTGKTAIAGTVMRNNRGNDTAASGATVLITKGTTVVGVTYTNTDGAFEIEVPADTGYRAIVNFIRFTASSTYNTYVPQIITDITVTEGATTTIKSTGKDYVYCGDVLAGDLDGDSDVDGDDYGTLAGNWTGKIN